MRSIVVAAILIAAGFGPAIAQVGARMTDERSACSVWDPLPVPDETVSWTGGCKDGLFDGQGVYVGFDGMRYDGEWKNGNFDGHGKLSFLSGVRYEGQFRANSYSGFGSMILPNGARYDGEYLLNTPHGIGVYKNASGSIYAGRWDHGCFRDGSLTAHLGVFPEDCGLAAAPDQGNSRDN